ESISDCSGVDVAWPEKLQGARITARAIQTQANFISSSSSRLRCIGRSVSQRERTCGQYNSSGLSPIAAGSESSRQLRSAPEADIFVDMAGTGKSADSRLLTTLREGACSARN